MSMTTDLALRIPVLRKGEIEYYGVRYAEQNSVELAEWCAK